MTKKKETSKKATGQYADPAVLISELFRALPVKRYSV